MNTPCVLVSVLNWNKAAITLECIDALQKMACEGIDVDILVVDNGSDPAEYAKLQAGIDAGKVQLLRVEKNLGFTGGHNLSLNMAMERNYDFIWLLNNDAIVESDALAKLVDMIVADPRCGAVSPVIYAEKQVGHLNAWGATHDWRARNTAWIPSLATYQQIQQAEPERICLVGTAVMFRVQAIREVGVLDERLFAYFDDNDIGTRLSHGGWHSKVALDTGVMHGARALSDQPLYFFYLMFRNELIFWQTHMPKPYRSLLWLKLVNQAIYNVNRLTRRGMVKQADSALLGVWDFICGRHGAPNLQRQAPWAMKLMCRVLSHVHESKQADIEATKTPA